MVYFLFFVRLFADICTSNMCDLCADFGVINDYDETMMITRI